ncbi:hypothetical protein ACA910_013843 [Epithemia clementina (nom. ined.)]
MSCSRSSCSVSFGFITAALMALLLFPAQASAGRIRGSSNAFTTSPVDEEITAKYGKVGLERTRQTNAQTLAWAKQEMIHEQLQLTQPDHEQSQRKLQSDASTGESELTERSYVYWVLADNYAVFDGIEFFDQPSYWNQALDFVERTSASMPNETIAQRYALCAIYHATDGIATPFTDVTLGTSGGSMPYRWNRKWCDDTDQDVNDECTWHGITCNSDKQVTEIDLHGNTLSGSFPIEVIILQNTLKVLDLEYNFVHNYGESQVWWLGELHQLEILDLGKTGFGYENKGLPEYLMTLTRLKQLALHETMFNGPMNETILGPLASLEYLDLGAVSFQGSTFPTNLRSKTALQYLYLDNGEWSGGLSNLIGDGTGFVALKELWVDANPAVSGSIPSSIVNIDSLISISFTDCGLTGGIPSDIGTMPNLKKLWLHDNALTGGIPSSLGTSRIQVVLVHDNQLSGSMPEELCNFRRPLGNLESLGADCSSTVTCTCCTCCGSSCDAP